MAIDSPYAILGVVSKSATQNVDGLESLEPHFILISHLNRISMFISDPDVEVCGEGLRLHQKRRC